MELHKLIARALEVRTPKKNIAYILDISLENLNKIIRDQAIPTGHTKQSNGPATYPTAYYIDRLRQQHTVKEIADDIGCSRQAVYKLLQDRNIEPTTIRNLNLKEDNHG